MDDARTASAGADRDRPHLEDLTAVGTLRAFDGRREVEGAEVPPKVWPVLQVDCVAWRQRTRQILGLDLNNVEARALRRLLQLRPHGLDAGEVLDEKAPGETAGRTDAREIKT